MQSASSSGAKRRKTCDGRDDDVTVYESDIQTDLLLLDWHQQLAVSGELETTFSTMAPLSIFMSEMRKCILTHETDDDGIWYAAWYAPAFGTASYHFWLRKEVYGSDVSLRAMVESLRFGLKLFRVIFTVNSSALDEIRGLHALGFTPLGGTVPELCGGNDMVLWWLDRAHFFGDETRDNAEGRH
jgi:hypothetical protein